MLPYRQLVRDATRLAGGHSGGGSIVPRGQLKPRTLALRTVTPPSTSRHPTTEPSRWRLTQRRCLATASVFGMIGALRIDQELGHGITEDVGEHVAENHHRDRQCQAHSEFAAKHLTVGTVALVFVVAAAVIGSGTVLFGNLLCVVAGIARHGRQPRNGCSDAPSRSLMVGSQLPRGGELVGHSGDREGVGRAQEKSLPSPGSAVRGRGESSAARGSAVSLPWW